LSYNVLDRVVPLASPMVKQDYSHCSHLHEMKSLCLRSYVHFVTSHRITSVYYIRTSCRSTFGRRGTV